MHIKLERLNTDTLTRWANAVIAKGYKKQKWVEFCETLIADGYECSLYDSKSTVSKYIYVKKPNTEKILKVRFSNHRPNYHKEVKILLPKSNSEIGKSFIVLVAIFYLTV
jgi:hypothetical protein